MTPPLTPEVVARLREACEKATTGPWNVRDESDGYADVTAGSVEYVPVRYALMQDADFIALAREWLPKLLDAYEAQQAERKPTRAEVALALTTDVLAGVWGELQTTEDEAEAYSNARSVLLDALAQAGYLREGTE